MKPPKRFASASFFLILFIAIIIAIASLKAAASVLIPITLAVMLSFVFEPLVNMIHKNIKLPNTICILLVMCIVVVAIFMVGTILISSIKTILEQYPKYELRFMTIYEILADLFKLPFDSDASLISNLWDQVGVRSFVQKASLSFSSSLISFLKNLTMVFLFIFFFLSEMHFFRNKLEVAFADVLPEKIRGIITDIINQIARYISVKFYISLFTGILVFVCSFLLKLDFPVIWAFIAFVMNFIPNFGSIISSGLTILFALLQFWPNPMPIFITAFFMIAINMTLGNFVEPKIQGKNLGLSPFVIIASLSAWGWIWGFAGMVLAVPLMVIVKIICENIEMLKPMSIILGSGQQTSK